MMAAMSQTPSDIADEIRLDEESGELLLLLRMDGAWSDTDLYTLQERINRCLGWLQSGQVFADWPTALECDLVIQVYGAQPPTQQALDFLEQAAAIIGDAGFLLRYPTRE